MVTSAPASLPAVEWERAQQLQISVDLISLAKEELRFLAVVNGTPALKNRQVLERAIDRYLNCWLPLASQYEPSATLLPPLDCAWVWHCHKLDPVQYAKDCQHLLGKLVDVAVPELSQATEVEATIIDEWTKAYPEEPYHFYRAGESPAENLPNFSPLKGNNTVAYDLIAAIDRQASFYFQVSRPWMYEERFLQVALERYRGFLHLIRVSGEKESTGGPHRFAVPTYDIDLLWRSHQLCPTAYRADTFKCIGKLLDHQASDSNGEDGAKLQNNFADTCDQWLATFGTLYEQAGSLYRGPEPARVAPPNPNNENPLDVAIGYPKEQEQRPILEDSSELTRRHTMQVSLVFLGAKNIYPAPKPGRKSHFYVRVTALRRCPGFKLMTDPVECTQDPPVEVVWNEGLSLEAELSTKGLRMELMSFTTAKSDDGHGGGVLEKLKRKVPGLATKPKCLGEVSIDWERDLLGSTTGLSLIKWISMAPPTSSKVFQKRSSSNLVPVAGEPLQLHFSVSITPPMPAPFIFCTMQLPVTDDTGLQVAKLNPRTGHRYHQKGRWMTRVVVDHCGQEQFVIRTRWQTGVHAQNRHMPVRLAGSSTEMIVHKGPLEHLGPNKTKIYGNEPLVRAPETIVTSARMLDASPRQNYREWSLFEGIVLLFVRKPTRSHPSLNCQIHGNIGYPMRLVSGRWLDYEVDASGVGFDLCEKDEANYLTLVRYTPEAPMGKATALMNWQSGAFEVKPDESVLLIVLISTTIVMSLMDMNFNYPNTIQKGGRVEHASFDTHLGAISIQRNGLSDRWNRPSPNQDMYWEMNDSLQLYTHHWWDLNSTDVQPGGDDASARGGPSEQDFYDSLFNPFSIFRDKFH